MSLLAIMNFLVIIGIVWLGAFIRQRTMSRIIWLLFLLLCVNFVITSFVSYRWEDAFHPLLIEDIVILFPISCAALALSSTGGMFRKSTLMGMVVFSLGLIVSLTAAEILLKTTNVVNIYSDRRGSIPTSKRNDRIDIFFSSIPSQDKQAELHNKRKTMKIFGMHNSHVVPDPNKMIGEKRILWLGDSMTEGAGVDESVNFVNILEKETKVPHYSLALGSSSTDVAAFLFERYSAMINPDVVILGFFPGNDYFEFGGPEIACGFNSVFALDRNGFKPNCTDVSDNILLNLYTRAPSIFIQYAASYTFLGNILMDKRDIMYRRVIGKLYPFHNPWPAFSGDKYSPEISHIENTDAVCSMLRRIKNDVEGQEAKFAMAIMPYVINSKEFLYPSSKPEMSAEAIKKCASELGIPVADTMEVFGPMQKSIHREEMFFSGMNVHMNPKGHKIAAEFLLPFENELLQKQSLFSSD